MDEKNKNKKNKRTHEKRIRTKKIDTLYIIIREKQKKQERKKNKKERKKLQEKTKRVQPGEKRTTTIKIKKTRNIRKREKEKGIWKKSGKNISKKTKGFPQDKEASEKHSTKYIHTAFTRS